MFTRYGYNTIAVALIISFILVIIAFVQGNIYTRILLITIAFFVVAFTLNFFRDPERIPPSLDNVVVSPADGKVLFVKEVQDDNFIKGKAKQISIFMSPLNVHVNRIPISGKVDYVKYFKGKFVAAFEDKASEVNERSEFGITSKYGKVFFTQVAGFVARRIVYELKQGDTVTIGKRFGMIKFGSRVDVVVPFDWTTKIKKDDIVSAGETILFEAKK